MKAVMSFIITLILAPFLKQFIEAYTTPETGLLAVQGVSEGMIAFINLLPWIIPLGAFVFMVISLSRRNDDEDDDRYDSRYDRRYIR